MTTWNIQHISIKFEQIKYILSSTTRPTEIGGFTETFLNCRIADGFYNIVDYNMERRDQINKHKTKSGGLLVYINNSLPYERHSDMEHDGIEAIWLEIKPTYSKHFLVCYIYRPPDKTSEIDSTIMNNIEHNIRNNADMYIMGDINIDWISNQKHELIQKLVDLGLHQVVNKITRPMTDTIIGHIYSNKPESIYFSPVSNISLSDHFPVSLVRKHHGSIAKRKSHKTIEYRNFKKFDSQMFHKDLVDAPWSILDSSEESDDMLYLWKTLFVSIIDKHVPLVETTC